MAGMNIGFIGFGEAGYNLAKGLRGAGAEGLMAYDINARAPRLGERIRGRAAETGTVLAESPADLAQASRVLLAVVTAHSALEAASQHKPFLKSHHIYADLNSVSPALKQDIGKEVSSSGARFVEAAVMAPVAPYGHRVPILLNGAAARELMEILSPFGMRLEAIDGEIGAAAAVKMCRSIVVKGLEALLFECVLGASRYGAEERVFASLQESFPGIKWNELANYMIGRVVVHGERRAHEMMEVADTLRAMDIEPIMAEATARRQAWAARLDLCSFFGPDGPATYQEVLQVLRNGMANFGKPIPS
jgi:3-hydroxyisobutyrate dehydrogenase-like beta-hydroxyacid dehydrogenase